MKDELEAFRDSLVEYGDADNGVPESWMAAFRRLRGVLERLPDGKKVVWGGTPEPNLWARREEGSHLFRTEGPRTKPVRWWYNRMKERRDIIRSSSGEFDFVMISDSLGHRWDNEPFFTEFTNTYSFLNLGYGGDRTSDVLGRIERGELDGYTAKYISLLIGANNGPDPAEETAKAFLAARFKSKAPDEKELKRAQDALLRSGMKPVKVFFVSGGKRREVDL